MANFPSYASNPRAVNRASVGTANTNRDGSGTIETIATGSAAGFKVLRVVAQATVSTTAGMIRLYLSTDGGSTWKLFDEIVVSVITVGPGVAGFRGEVAYTDLTLYGTSVKLGASTHNAENHEVWALGGDF